MRRRSILVAAVCLAGPAAHCAAESAAGVVAQLFPLTGEVRLVNRDPSPIPFVFYSITSAANALDPSSEVWQSISDHYDVSGSGLIDSGHEWFKLADDPDELTEAVFSGPGGNLPATRAISLGNIWDPFAVPFPDLAFEVWNDEESIPVTIELAIDGDYSSDQVVDQADYVVWRRYLDSITMLLPDGDLSGDVDENDYLVWQANFGLSVPLPPYALGGGSQSSLLPALAGVVPEPATCALALIAISAIPFLVRRNRGY